MKKVLLTSAAVLAVFSAAAPVFAQGENPNASNQLIQKKYVSERDIADEANAYADSHAAEIAEMVEKEPAVIAARAALAKAEAIVGHTHEKAVAATKAELEEVLADKTNVQRNRVIQRQQEVFRDAAKAQGNYWNDEKGIDDNKRNSDRIADDIENNTGKRPGASNDATNPSATPEPGKPGAVDQAKKADDAAKKAGASAKAGQKALPKTHAAK